jgi:hypothetical protein
LFLQRVQGGLFVLDPSFVDLVVDDDGTVVGGGLQQ